MRALVIIPTYNELENVRPLTAEIFKTIDAAIASGELSGLHFEALIVDDNSPDRTDDAVRDIQKTAPFGSRLNLLSRPGKKPPDIGSCARFVF